MNGIIQQLQCRRMGMGRLLPFMLVVFILAQASMASANAVGFVSFNFIQSGFEEGATVTGMFGGEDGNGDGLLSSFQGEVTSFMMSFSGNSVVPAFSLDSTDFFDLVYELSGGGVLGDSFSEGMEASDGFFQYIAGLGPLDEDCDDDDVCGVVLEQVGGVNLTEELVIVTPKGNVIPEPSTMLLFGSGLAGLGWWRYRKTVKA